MSPYEDGYRKGMQEAARIADSIEGKRVPIPCPDNKPGCLVAHYRLEPGPIGTKIREAIR